jgi:hypothetical protein
MYKTTIALLIAVALLSGGYSLAGTYQIAPTEDTWVYSFAPDNNYGSDAGLGITIHNMSQAGYTFLKFTMPTLQSGEIIKSARLYLYQYGGAGYGEGPTALDLLSNNTWSETTATWNNHPEATYTRLATNTDGHSHVGWSSWSFTWSANYGNTISLRLAENSSGDQSHNWYSKEYAGSYKPYLELTTGYLSQVFASFPGYGLYSWNGFTWTLLTSSSPESMVASGSTLYGDFGAIGLWKHDGSGWSLLSSYNPETMVASGSTLYVGFGAIGLWRRNESGWSQLSSSSPESMVASGSTLYGDFGAIGLWKHDGSGWSRLKADNPETMVASDTSLYVGFGAIGLWKHDGSGWSQLSSYNPEGMVASGSTLCGDFGAIGLWKHDESGWSQLKADNPTILIPY